MSERKHTGERFNKARRLFISFACTWLLCLRGYFVSCVRKHRQTWTWDLCVYERGKAGGQIKQWRRRQRSHLAQLATSYLCSPVVSSSTFKSLYIHLLPGNTHWQTHKHNLLILYPLLSHPSSPLICRQTSFPHSIPTSLFWCMFAVFLPLLKAHWLITRSHLHFLSLVLTLNLLLFPLSSPSPIFNLFQRHRINCHVTKRHKDAKNG